MIPGTTPTFILTLKNAQGYLGRTTNLRVDIRQQDVIIKKNLEDVVLDTESNSIEITLTEKETLQFLYKKGVIEFQIHGILDDGTVWKTYVVDVPVDRTLTRDSLGT